MTEVFITDVQEQLQANELITILQHYFPASKVNFDLEDCDKILRVEGDNIPHHKVIDIITKSGYCCRILE